LLCDKRIRLFAWAVRQPGEKKKIIEALKKKLLVVQA